MDTNQMNQDETQQAMPQDGTQQAVPQDETQQTMPPQTVQQQDYQEQWQEMPYQETGYTYQEPVADSKDGMCVAALILGIVGFFLNPFYVCSILSIVFGAIGMKANGEKSSLAKVGLILGIANFGIQFILDLITTICTAGMGGFSFCC